MTNLSTLPINDDFETTLSSSWNGAVGTVSVNDTPTGSMPASTYSYIVVNPWLSNMQVAKIDGWVSDTSFNVTDIDIPYWPGGNYTAKTHAANSVVRFSNNYAFWKDIQTAIATKADQSDIDVLLGNFTFTDSEIEATGSMTFSDGETSPVTLKTLATGAPADQYVAVSENDTTVWHLDDKFGSWAWLTETITNPAWNEVLTVSIDTSDTDIFVKNSSGAGDEDKVPVLDATGKLAAWFIDVPWTVDVKSLTAGENVDGSTTPQAVYVSDGTWSRTSGRYYLADANDATYTDSDKFFGFVTANTTAGSAYDVTYRGIVSWFTGLTVWAIYYLSTTAGSITTTSWPESTPVGIAISTTEIRIRPQSTLLYWRCAASDTLQVSADTEQSKAGTWFTIKKRVVVPATGTYRVKFDLKYSGAINSVEGRVYRNGTAYWTLQSTNSATYVTKSEDLFFYEGDYVELYIQSTNGATTCLTQNFRLYYDLVPYFDAYVLTD